MKQADNVVYIEGLLQEVDLKEGTLPTNGKEYVAGDIVLNVKQTLKNGEVEENEIPVSVFATKLKNDGGANPAYKNICEIQNNCNRISIAGKEKADTVRLTTGQLFENSYPGQDGRLRSFGRVRGSFFNKVGSADSIQRATFKVKIVVLGFHDEVENDEPTGRMILKGALVQYGDRVDVIDFVVEDPAAIKHIEANWNVNDTVKCGGILRYKAETVKSGDKGEEIGFGDEIPDFTNRMRREFVITAGAAQGLDEEFAYSVKEIKEALLNRKAEQEKKLNAAQEKSAAGASSGSSSNGKYGF